MYSTIRSVPTVLIKKDGSIKEVDFSERLNHHVESLFQMYVIYHTDSGERYRVKVVIISLSEITDSHTVFINEVGISTIKRHIESLK